MRSMVYFLFCFITILFSAVPVSATQSHGAPEGLYVHQFTHLFFLVAMGFLVYWLQARGLSRQPGWKQIRYAAFFFMLWTIDAFGVHLIDEQFEWVIVSREGPWQMRLDATIGFEPISRIYYFMKMDHLLCVPGLIFLAIGLGRLGKYSSSADRRGEDSS